MGRRHDAERGEPTMNAQELLLRESDRSRLDRLVRGLLEERLNAVVVADDEGLLDHYGRLFSGRLRQQSAVKVEVYFPNSTEAVLARFNRILADLKVSDAIAPQGSTADQRVLVVYDGQATDLKEVQLLGRLLRDFPGANTRVLMLLSRAGTEAEQKVEALGKKALRWDLHRPTPDEARVLLERATALGSVSEAQALLNSVGVQGLEEAMALKAGLHALAKADAALGPLGTPQQAANFAASLQRAAQKAEQSRTERSSAADPVEARASVEPAPVPAPAQNPSPPASTPKRKAVRSPLLLAGLLALTASAALTRWQHLGDRVVSELMPAQRLAAAESGHGATKPSGAVLDAEGTPMKTLGPLPEQVSNEELQRERRNSPLPSVPEPEPEPPRAVTVKPEPPKPEPPKPAEGRAPASVAAPSAAPADLKTVAPGFYVQHASRETRAEALDYWKSHPGLAKARLLKLKRIGAQGDNFVLLSGPFKTLEEARAFTQRAGVPKDNWIRQASALKKLLPETAP